MFIPLTNVKAKPIKFEREGKSILICSITHTYTQIYACKCARERPCRGRMCMCARTHTYNIDFVVFHIFKILKYFIILNVKH